MSHVYEVWCCGLEKSARAVREVCLQLVGTPYILAVRLWVSPQREGDPKKSWIPSRAGWGGKRGVRRDAFVLFAFFFRGCRKGCRRGACSGCACCACPLGSLK